MVFSTGANGALHRRMWSVPREPFPDACHLPPLKGNAVKTPFAKTREILALPETAQQYGHTLVHLLLAIAALSVLTLLAVLGTR
jgi:hypothetical protein